MLIEGFKWMNLADEVWGEIKLLVPRHKKGDPWGPLAAIRDTFWGAHIRVVTGAAFSDAMRGSATRLMREIGPEPKHLCVQIPDVEGVCRNAHACPLYKVHCRPGKKVPDCYEPPGDWSPQESVTISHVVLAWAEGRYVIVVEGAEW